MKDKLCVSERRFRIVDLLIANKILTRQELATEFNVTLDTISRDLLFLSNHIPIYTKPGVGGGISILSGYKSYNYYLSIEERDFMLSLLDIIPIEKRETLRRIIAKYVKDFA